MGLYPHREYKLLQLSRMSHIIYHLDGNQINLPLEGITQAIAPYVRKINGYPALVTKKFYYMVDHINNMESLVKIICGGINNPSDDGVIIFRQLMIRFTGDSQTEWMERPYLASIMLDEIAEDERQDGLHFYEAKNSTPQQTGGRKTKRSRRQKRRRRQTRRGRN